MTSRAGVGGDAGASPDGSASELRALLESTDDAIWSVDREGRAVQFNTACQRLLESVTGRRPQIGDTPEDLMSPAAAQWFRECYERALRGARFTVVREENVGGRPVVWELCFNPVEGDSSAHGGDYQGVVVFTRDVTRQRMVEKALLRAKNEAEAANRAKSHFLAQMSHELRTPLNSIIGFSRLLRKKGVELLPERELGFLGRIEANGHHLLQLINEILDLSKVESGHLEPEIEPVALGELVEETLAEREAEVADRPVELRAEGTSRHAEIHTDRGRLKQILINLVANALRFTESGNVTVRIEHGEGDSAPVALHVEDTGIGIPSDRLDAIFEAFQQAEDGTARRYGGTGLGLTISRSLCHMLGFALEVHSEVGEGSTFTVRFQPESTEPELPREGMPVRPAEDRWSDQGDGGEERPLEGRTVLVVDDEQDARTLLRSALEDLGATVLEATNGLEGLEVARRVEPHLITLDLMMPGMDGSEFMRRLRRDPQLMDTPVVVVSMLAGEDGHRFVGAADVLSKPVEASDLEGVVSRLVGTSEGRVLVVEDDPDARHLLLRYLTDSGLDADGVDSAEAALAYMDRTPVGLLILDLVLPGMDGMELMERMRSMDSLASLPMVVLTGRELSREEEDIIRGHGARLVHKREDVDRELRRALDALFGRRGEQHDQ